MNSNSSKKIKILARKNINISMQTINSQIDTKRIFRNIYHIIKSKINNLYNNIRKNITNIINIINTIINSKRNNILLIRENNINVINNIIIMKRMNIEQINQLMRKNHKINSTERNHNWIRDDTDTNQDFGGGGSDLGGRTIKKTWGSPLNISRFNRKNNVIFSSKIKNQQILNNRRNNIYNTTN